MTDVAQRLALVAAQGPAPWGPCLALYAAQELVGLISQLRMQSNTITRRISLSPGFQSKLAPHAPLISILSEKLHFVPDPQSNGREVFREEFFTPEELGYLKLLERDLLKWIAASGTCPPYQPPFLAVACVAS